jgi:6-phosphogluconolactonase
MLKAEWREFPSADALAEALAGHVANVLSEAIDKRGIAVLAVSGGSTPGRFFDALCQRPIAWAKVIVTLVDERFVPETDERSNASLVKARLLTKKAAEARFVPFYSPTESVEEAARAASEYVEALPLPFDVVVLGMGTDGHTASFFPDAANLSELLAPDSARSIMPVHAPSAGEPRLTISLARLLEARFVALHIEGTAKRAVLEEALTPGRSKPITAVFANSSKPLPVYWAG